MKKTIKSLAIALVAMIGAACTEIKPVPTLPSVEVGEVTLAEDETSATVEIVPSANTAEIHWICVENGGVEYENGTVSNEKFTLTIPGIKLDTDYTLTVWTKNEAGESEKVEKKFNFKAEEILKELVEIREVNATSITMSVYVTKSVKCSRFVIGAQKKLMKQVNEDGSSEMVPFFKDEDFIEQAEASLAAADEYKKGEAGDHFKMFCPYLVSAKSGIYSDYEFKYAKYLDKEGESAGVEIEAGETYVIAVYALDAEGTGKLYTMDYTAAEKTEVKGAVDIKVEFIDMKTSYTEVKARITAGSDCKRVFYGISVPDEYAGAGSQDMETMSNSEFEELLLKLGLGRSHAYEGTPMEVVLKDNIEQGVRRVVWAIGVDEQGNIGKVERAYFQAPYYSPTGTGKFTSYDFADADDKNSVNITLTVDENTTAVRFLPFTMDDYQTFRNRIDWLMFLTGTEAMYKEYPVNDGKVEINFAYHPGDREKNQIYYFLAATVDADENIGRSENIVQKKYGWSKMYWEVPQIESADDALTFDGTGAATVTMEETIIPGSEWDTPKAKTLFTVTFGANTKAVYYFKFASAKPNPDIEALIKELCSDKKRNLAGEANYTLEASGTLPQNYLTTFTTAYTPDILDEYYGTAGDCAAFVTEDNDGNFKIVAVYYAGGVKNDVTYNGNIVTM